MAIPANLTPSRENPEFRHEVLHYVGVEFDKADGRGVPRRSFREIVPEAEAWVTKRFASFARVEAARRENPPPALGSPEYLGLEAEFKSRSLWFGQESEHLEFTEDVSLAEIVAAESNAIVKGLLRPGECGIIYGDSGAGKTFVAIDLGWHVALGINWHGFKVKRRPVLYVALEGVGGFKKRMLAAKEVHGKSGNYFARLKIPVSLVRAAAGAAGVESIAEGFRQLLAVTGEETGLIVIDTLARAMAGDDENSTADMTHFVEQRLAAIQRATGAAVAVVHHTNKLGDIRGNTSLKGANDLVIRIERDGNKRRAIAEKIKDGEEGPLFGFELKQIALGTDADGVPITSCTLQAAEVAPSADGHGKRSKPEAKPVRVFRSAFNTVVSRDMNREAMPLSDVKREFYMQYPTGESDAKAAGENKRKAWQRAVKDMPSEFKVRDLGGGELVWLLDPVWPSPSDLGQDGTSGTMSHVVP